MNFKFYWVNQKGEQSSVFAKKGAIHDDILVLEDSEIPAAAIIEADVRGQFLVLTIATGDGEPASMVIKAARAARIKEELGRLRSAAWAEMHHKHLKEQGLGDTFRAESCPACDAVVDLTNWELTPQLHCDFCHTISTIETEEGDIESEHGYRLCDECGMYSRPRHFTIFYFYFLVFVYGWSSRSTWRCPGCMRGEAWKMFFGNLVFVLGVPVALVQLFRSYGGSSLGGLYPGLDKANLLAKNGDLERAVQNYQDILRRRPVSAGVKFNIGLTFLQQQRTEEAARMFEYALADCSNYQPAASALFRCYDTLGDTEKLAELKRIWAPDAEEVPADE